MATDLNINKPSWPHSSAKIPFYSITEILKSMARLRIKTPWSYEPTDSWFDVTSVNFNSQKVHEDKIFERQDILQFLSQGCKYYNIIL